MRRTFTTHPPFFNEKLEIRNEKLQMRNGKRVKG